MPTKQGCPQMFFGLLIVDVLIKHPTRNLTILHAAITRIVRDAVQYRCFRSMLGVYTPLPLRNEPRSNIQQSGCLRVDEILVLLNQQLGLAFDRDDLLDLAVRIGETM